MKPTPQHLEAVAAAIFDEGRGGHQIEAAERAWNVIAPLVLEAAAKVAETAPLSGTHCERDTLVDCAARIRALKDAK